MAKGSGTRSGLLWEVERILNECGTELPQVLLMENVPQIISKANIDDFKQWELFLESKGYTNYIKILNSKDYGIPQNRKRCFMVSLLGEYSYTFPKKQKLTLTLGDMLEENVDEKYFLSQKMMEYISHRGTGKFKNPDSKINLDIARPITTEQNKRAGTTNYICNQLPKNYDLSINIKDATKTGYRIAHAGDGVVVNQYGQLKIRRLTEKEAWIIMGFSNDDYNKAEQVTTPTKLYYEAGNSIVVNVLMAIFKEML